MNRSFGKIERPTWSRRSDINVSCMRQQRAGIIPYLIDDCSLWFCFGVDKRTKELTDFAGRSKKSDVDIDGTAIRECREESLDVFLIDSKTLEDADPMYIYDDRSVTIFIPVEKLEKISPRRDAFSILSSNKLRPISKIKVPTLQHMSAVRNEKVRQGYISSFSEAYSRLKSTRKVEVVDITWLHEKELISIISQKDTRMYSRVRCLLRDISKIIPMIRNMSAEDSSPATLNFLERKNLMQTH